MLSFWEDYLSVFYYLISINLIYVKGNQKLNLIFMLVVIKIGMLNSAIIIVIIIFIIII